MRSPIVVLALAACTSEAPPAQIDAPPSNPDADQSSTCLISTSFGALGAITGTVGNAMGAPTATFVLDEGPPGKDDLFIKLVSGQGVFAAGVTTGTFPITGAEADYNACGLCVILIADIIPMQGPSKFFMANTGSVTLTQTGSTITGTVDNVTFREIDLSGAPSGSCMSKIDSTSFTAN